MIEIIDVYERALELLEASPDFGLHPPEAIHETGDLGWREVVL